MPGLHDFTAGDVLTAAQCDDLARQNVIQCTSGTRPGSPHEGMTIFETDTDRLAVYSGSAWVRVGASSSTGSTGCVLERASAQSIPTSEATISWDSETVDTDGFIAVPSGTVTIPSNMGGIYTATVKVAFATPMNSALGGILKIQRNSTYWSFPIQILDQESSGSATLRFSAGDTLTVLVTQSSGSANNMTARLDFWRHGF